MVAAAPGTEARHKPSKRHSYRYSDRYAADAPSEAWVSINGREQLVKPPPRIAPPAATFTPRRHAHDCRCYECATDMAERVLECRADDLGPDTMKLIATAADGIELLAQGRDWWDEARRIAKWSDGIARPISFAQYRHALDIDYQDRTAVWEMTRTTIVPGTASTTIRDSCPTPWTPDVEDGADSQETAIMAAALRAMPFEGLQMAAFNEWGERLLANIESYLSCWVEFAGVGALA